MPDRDEGTTDGLAQDPQEPCGSRPDIPEEDWVLLAWRAWLHGERNWTALGKQFGHDYRTVRSRVMQHSKAVAAAYATGSVDALSEYVEGLYEDLRDADNLQRNTKNENAKLGAIRSRTDVRKLIAAAKGVVTERKSAEVTGAGGGPVLFEVVIGGAPAPPDEGDDGSGAAAEETDTV